MTDKKEKIMKKQASREQKFFNRSRRIFQWIVTHIGYQAFLKLIYRLEVQGKENIPKDNAYIVAPNHLSLLDPPMVASVFLNLTYSYRTMIPKVENAESQSEISYTE